MKMRVNIPIVRLQALRNDKARAMCASSKMTGIFSIIMAAILFMICSATYAKLPDDSQPLTIKSDAFHYDNQKGIATYTGHVLATQGTRRLMGDRLEIYRNEQTGKMERIVVHGSPAYYEGLTELDKPPVHAQAKLITYDVPTKFLTLTQDAQVEQEGDIYRAWKIEYDGLKGTVYSPPSEQGQTTIILKETADVGI